MAFPVEWLRLHADGGRSVGEVTVQMSRIAVGPQPPGQTDPRRRLCQQL